MLKPPFIIGLLTSFPGWWLEAIPTICWSITKFILNTRDNNTCKPLTSSHVILYVPMFVRLLPFYNDRLPVETALWRQLSFHHSTGRPRNGIRIQVLPQQKGNFKRHGQSPKQIHPQLVAKVETRAASSWKLWVKSPAVSTAAKAAAATNNHDENTGGAIVIHIYLYIYIYKYIEA